MKAQYLAAWRLKDLLRVSMPMRAAIAGSQFTGGHFVNLEWKSGND